MTILVRIWMALLVGSCVTSAHAAAIYEETFARIGSLNVGEYPRGLVQAPDGNFYGTTSAGGMHYAGAAFRVTPDGTITAIHSFSQQGDSVGGIPSALTVGTDGDLYGLTTSFTSNFFRMSLDGEVTVLGVGLYGDVHAPLVEASDGTFYGTYYGSDDDTFLGGVVRFAADGTQLFVTAFTGPNGSRPEGALIEGKDGLFYGTTAKGGANGLGTIFSVSPAGEVTTLYSFAGPDGARPRSGLVSGPDGNFYGTTYNGGANYSGTVYRFSPGSGVTTLFSFGKPMGEFPSAGLTMGRDGYFYGTTDSGTFYRISLKGQFTLLAELSDEQGSSPSNTLVQGSDGRFYGAALYGGEYGTGAVFRATRGGTVTRLASLGDPQGFGPLGVIEASDGNFYGSASVGGAFYKNSGSLYRITPGGAVTDVVDFDQSTSGRAPTQVVQGPDGNLYGATSYLNLTDPGYVFRCTLSGQLTLLTQLGGGLGTRPLDIIRGADGYCYGLCGFGGANNAGVVFQISPAGVVSPFASLHVGPLLGSSFLTQDEDGTLYGTSSQAQSNPSGIVFKISPAGIDSIWVSFLHSDFAIGVEPYGGIHKGLDGNFYGVARSGGDNSYGAIFRIDPSGTLSRVVSFPQSADSVKPSTGLALADDGSFYGLTDMSGNVADGGSVFNVTTDGNLTTAATFEAPDGADASGRVIKASDGYYYAGTLTGGVGGGAILRFTSYPPELDSFHPAGGNPGEAITITGKYLAGVSNVMFNGVPASFHIDDSKHITAIVPAGATTGPLKIVNPLGQASSALSFASPPLDSDGDGIPDEYEMTYFGSPTAEDPLLDSDNDGQDNLAEYRAGTSPIDPLSVLRISNVRRDGGDVVITFFAEAHRRYRVEASSEPASSAWSAITTIEPAGEGAVREITDDQAAAHSHRFYRAVVLP